MTIKQDSSSPIATRRSWLVSMGTICVALTMALGAVIGVVAQDSGDVTPGTDATSEAQDLTPAAAGTTAGEDVTPATGGDTANAKPYLVPVARSGAKIRPLLTAGEKIGSYQAAGGLSGLGAAKAGSDVVLYVNHDLSPSDNISTSRVSQLVLDGKTGEVKQGRYAVGVPAGYQSLSAGSLPGQGVGFARPIFLTGEESTDSVHGGLMLSIDAATAKQTELPWLGHFPHAGQLVVPGFTNKAVVFLTDGDAQDSEVFVYIADSQDDVLSGKGQLYVFKADDGDNAADIAKGDDVSGTFVPVDVQNNADAAAFQAAAKKAGGLKFGRLGDAATDRTNTTTVYFSDRGSRAAGQSQAGGRNGRVYSMTLDPQDPTKVTSLKVLLDGDAGDAVRSPNGMDATKSTLMIAEDRQGGRLQNPANGNRVLAYDIASGALTPVARVDPTADTGADVDADRAGSMAAAGIIDVSPFYGEGTWLVTIQAPNFKVAQFGENDEGGQLVLLQYTAAAPAGTPAGAVPTTSAPPAPPVPTEAPAEVATLEPVPTEEPPVIEPTEIPPTEIPPTEIPPTEIPPTEIPPTEIPPTEIPPTEIPPTEIPPTEEPTPRPTGVIDPTEEPTEIPPTEIPPTEDPGPRPTGTVGA